MCTPSYDADVPGTASIYVSKSQRTITKFKIQVVATTSRVQAIATVSIYVENHNEQSQNKFDTEGNHVTGKTSSQLPATPKTCWAHSSS